MGRKLAACAAHARSRWKRLAVLTTALEKLMEANARLDTYEVLHETRAAERLRLVQQVEGKLNTLIDRIDREESRITAARLLEDLARKQGVRTQSAEQVAADRRRAYEARKVLAYQRPPLRRRVS